MSSTPWYVWIGFTLTTLGLIFRNQLSQIGDKIVANKDALGNFLFKAGFFTISYLTPISILIVAYFRWPFDKYYVLITALAFSAMTLSFIFQLRTRERQQITEIIRERVRYERISVYNVKVASIQKKIDALENPDIIGRFASDEVELKKLKEELEELKRHNLDL